MKARLSSEFGKELTFDTTSLVIDRIEPYNYWLISLQHEGYNYSLEFCYACDIFVYDKLEVMKNNYIQVFSLDTRSSRVRSVNSVCDPIRKKVLSTTYSLALVTKL